MRTRPYGWTESRIDRAHGYLNEMEAATIRGNRLLARDWSARVVEMLERHGNFEGHEIRERWLRIKALDTTHESDTL